jgi:hypothetical protein
MTRWITGRKVLTSVLVVAGSAELWFGKLPAEPYVYLMLGCLAGHHLPDILKAWRGNGNAGNTP